MTREIHYAIGVVCDLALLVALLAGFFGAVPAHTAINWALVACIPGAIRGFLGGLLS
jgi:hypothetical protein